MPAAILDTDVFSYLCIKPRHKRHGWRVAYERFLDAHGIGTNFAISVISVGEILDGIQKGGISFQRLEILRVAFANTTILPVTVDTAQAYADFSMPKGRNISVNDRWIGATSLEHNIPLVSNDQVFKSATKIDLLTLSLS